MEFIDFLDKHASAIFGIAGTVIGFIGNFILQKWNQKFEITKDIAKEHYKERKNVLTKSLQLISDYETKLKTLHDFIEDENGIPIRELKKEDVFTKYFLLIFEYLHYNRFYLENETIKKLDRLTKAYHNYLLKIKFVTSEYNNDDIPFAIDTAKQNLLENTEVLFNKLIEEIKYDEVQNFKAKLEAN